VTGHGNLRALAARLVRAADERHPVSRRDIAIDTVVAVAATIIVVATVRKTGSGAPGVITLYQGPATDGAPRADGSLTAAVLLSALTTAPLALRRIFPLTAFWVIVAAAAAGPHYAENVITLGAVVLAAYSAMAYTRFRLGAILSMPVAVLLDVAYLHSQAAVSPLPPRSIVVLVLFPVLVLGGTIRQWRRQVTEARSDLARLQAEHEADTASAIAAERARIASELHDVVTHNVSMMIVQAGAARQVLDEEPDRAKAALLAVESSGRAAMAELRSLLGLLSQAPEAAGTEPDELQPQPGLGQIPLLVDRVRAAGLPVRLDTGDLPHDLPAGVGLTVYRVVQEALTNVVRHAGRPATTVSLSSGNGSLVAEVANAGPPLSAVRPLPGRMGGGGRGLLGMRERAALYGGEVSAGPTPHGGWLVRLRLPIEPTRALEPGRTDVVAAVQAV
jgi:signal transduction histidine kinase